MFWRARVFGSMDLPFTVSARKEKCCRKALLFLCNVFAQGAVLNKHQLVCVVLGCLVGWCDVKSQEV